MAETFLKRVFGKVFAGRAAPSRVILGAFGKHPGYPEHFEDLDAQAILTRVREQLYTRGVQAAVDAGVWKELDDQGKALPFRHTLVWRTGGSGGGSIVIGRMLASRDKLGRDKYPVVVVAVCPGDALEFALQRVLPWVQSVIRECVAAAALPEVRSVIARARESSPTTPGDSDRKAGGAADGDRALAFLVRCPELGEDAKGLVNILYQVDREMSAFVPASTSSSGSRTKNVSRRSAHIRVPRCGKSTTQAVAAWFGLLNGILAESAPILLMIPDEEPGVPAWVDIVVGTASEAEFFYLRSSIQTTPCTSDIPYTIPPEFAAKTRERFKAATDEFAAPVEILGASTPVDAGFTVASLQ